MHGSAEKAHDTISEALDYIDQHTERFYEAELHHLRGRAFLEADASDGVKAEEAFKRSIEIAQFQKAKLWEIRAATPLSRLWKSQGKIADASDLLYPVCD